MFENEWHHHFSTRLLSEICKIVAATRCVDLQIVEKSAGE